VGGKGEGVPGEPAEEEEEEEEDQAPSKIVTAEATLTVRARVMTVDMEGRADARSLRTMLTRSAPRHLVLLQGTPQVCPPSLPCSLGGGGEGEKTREKERKRERERAWKGGGGVCLLGSAYMIVLL
jgi:hypothetical protein